MRMFVLEGDLNNSITGLRSHLIRHICDGDNHVTIIGGYPDKSKFGKSTINPAVNCRVKPLSLNALSPLVVLKAIFKLLYFCYLDKPDHVLAFNIRPILIWGFCNRVLKIKSTATITGTITYRNGEGLNRFYKIILNTCLKGYHNLVFQNKYDYQLLDQIGVKNCQERRLIEGSGVDIDFFVNDNAKFKTWDFIYIGRLLKEKGIIEFLQASHRLLKKYPKIRVAVIGPFYSNFKGGSKLVYSEIEHYFVENRIVYLGESKNVKTVLLESKSLVLPSYGEGLSNVLLEAASMGLPLIATDVPGCKDVIIDGYNGFLCKAMDSYDLELKMERLLILPDENKSEMGQKSREIAISRFPKEKIVHQYMELLNFDCL